VPAASAEAYGADREWRAWRFLSVQAVKNQIGEEHQAGTVEKWLRIDAKAWGLVTKQHGPAGMLATQLGGEVKDTSGRDKHKTET
jgi:hypothetical protein